MFKTTIIPVLWLWLAAAIIGAAVYLSIPH